MLSASNLFKREIRENQKVTISARINYADGQSEELDGSRFMANTVSFDDSVSASGKFEIGASIINNMSFVLNNFDGHFNERDFTEAEIIPTIKKSLSDGSIELIPKGFFCVEQPKTYGSTISISSYDRMKRFEKPFSEVSGIVYPTTALLLLNAVCTHCGVVLNTQDFTNKNFEIKKEPDGIDTMSCLDVVSYIAQICGCYARFNVLGTLDLKWYDTDIFANDLIIDGGSYKFEEQDIIDGGDFSDYSSENIIDGGSFTDKAPYQIYSNKNTQIVTDDVVITGIKVVVDEEEFLSGQVGYVLTIENNPFIDSDNANSIATFLGNKIIGMTFRPFSTSTLSDPTLEAGDSIYVVQNGNYYGSFITHLSYKIGSLETVQCDAETPSRNNASSYSATTKAIVKSRKETKKQLSAYDVSMQQLTSLMANSFGVFKTEEKKEDGSVIYYMHNKPTLSESHTIWKMTGNAFAVSTDGGKTWNAGFDAQGNAVVNVLSAIGIRFDWARGGILTLGGVDDKYGELIIANENDEIVGSWDNNGIHAVSGTIGGFNLGISSIYNGTLSMQSSNEGVYIGTDGINLGGKFKVTKTGDISASSGTIGGFTIGESSLYSGSSIIGETGTYIGDDGISVGTNIFKVTELELKYGNYFKINYTTGDVTLGYGADIKLGGDLTFDTMYPAIYYGSNLSKRISFDTIGTNFDSSVSFKNSATFTEGLTISSSKDITLKSSIYDTILSSSKLEFKGSLTSTSLQLNSLLMSSGSTYPKMTLTDKSLTMVYGSGKSMSFGDGKISCESLYCNNIGLSSTEIHITLTSGQTTIGSSAYNHRLGFFGSSGTTKKSCTNASYTDKTTAKKVGDDLNALKTILRNHGLIS